MFRSLRARVVGWQALVLTLALAGFGVGLFQLVRRAKLREIDAQLEGTAQVLATRFRRYPFHWKNRGSSWWSLFARPKSPDADGSADRASNGSNPPGDAEAGLFDSLAKRLFRRNPLELPERFSRRFGDDPEQPPYFVVWHPDGEVLVDSESGVARELPDHPTGEDSFYIRQEGPRREIVLAGPEKSLVVVGVSIRREIAELDTLAMSLLGTGLAVLVAALAGGWFVAKKAIGPIGAISAAAESISASNLSRRIDVASTETELGALAGVLNRTFDRLQDSFRKQTRFTADASHELRTPVSVILTHTELARQRERDPDEYRETIDVCHRAATRMKLLVDGLLTLTRSDSGDLDLRTGPVDLRALAEDCADLLGPLAREKGVTVDLALQPVEVIADAGRVTQVVMNLVTNAIKYNRPGGSVEIRLETAGENAVLVVADNGVGISAADRSQIFERFYRVDEARTSEAGGSGLGLAISQAIVEALGGSIVCESAVSTGSTFTVRIPRSG